MSAGPPAPRPENPIVGLRHKLGMGQAEFARVLGVSLPALWAAETGTTARPTAVLGALQRLHYDTASLSELYARWRADLLKDEGTRLRTAFEKESHSSDTGLVSDRPDPEPPPAGQ